MFTQICKAVNNYFTKDEDKHIGTFTIVNGAINPPISIANNRYYRITGSIFNDGVHKFGDPQDVLTDEAEFNGAIWLMNIPKDFIELAGRIKEWQTANGSVDSANMSPYTSESFDIYSYSKGSNSGSGKSGTAVTWQSQFADELSRYRKVGIQY